MLCQNHTWPRCSSLSFLFVFMKGVTRDVYDHGMLQRTTVRCSKNSGTVSPGPSKISSNIFLYNQKTVADFINQALGKFWVTINVFLILYPKTNNWGHARSWPSSSKDNNLFFKKFWECAPSGNSKANILLKSGNNDRLYQAQDDLRSMTLCFS